MGSIELKQVQKCFGDMEVIQGVDLAIPEGSFTVFVGPSGCGKSTLMRLISGLEPVTSGHILIDEIDVSATPPAKRELAMVFQSYALYPHMTVAENMAFGLRTKGVPAEERRVAVAKAAEILKLTEYLDRKPKALSGGQRQRVAIGRCIVRQPKAFLFDEPLSNLDAALRVEMRFELAHLHATLGTTMVYVTHDQVEAMTLADQIVVLNKGRVMQVGSPRTLYEHPANLFVAQFIGSPKMNVLPIDAVTMGRIPRTAEKIGIRPEALTLGKSEGKIEGKVVLVEYMGADSLIYVEHPTSGQITVRQTGPVIVSEGEQIQLGFAYSDCHLFDVNGDVIQQNLF